MSRIVFTPTPSTQRIGAFTLGTAKRWTSSLGVWGVGLGTAAVFFLSTTPKVKNTFLVKIPVLGSYYQDKTPACDKPF
ncbi:uncharacterized protein STEHIDRAFT_145327 [Stereum hirsutum FP-91666 SS1]|uniref:uncharacterized protein n=1 Tax=Stereum hirsutum (strain FP-91666) TaxID=721885 RepID=UPI000440C9DA|nr:uncharacterized protein STEHIDRAFT_145327 [Stereum hirsutum FP-91666 SS1]EIM90197.1 hypothetical protein STEHIDRAFT_145327 [Stereum hirsutum FP-91666 SS1]